MPVSFPATANFVGRDEYIARFRARIEHFRFFLYEGISGIGKTALLLRLAKETKSLGIRGALYLSVAPGETITSILARVEAGTGSGRTSSERQGDPYARLVEYLNTKKVVLLLDELHHLRREEMLSLLRAVRSLEGKQRILAAGRGEPELSAVDRANFHLERVGPLSVDEVKKIGGSSLKGQAQETVLADVARGGCTGHPMTLRCLLGLFGNDMPPPDFFAGHSSRSINAFRAVLNAAEERLDEKERATLGALAKIGMPIAKTVATRVLGANVTRLVKRGMIETIGDEVMLHDLVAQAFSEHGKLSDSAAKSIAKHLKDRGESKCEPLRVLRSAELLARANAVNKAVDTLSTIWLTVREFGFLEAFLKTVASMPKGQAAIERRLKLLSARARMRQGNVHSVRDELEQLAKERDTWTRTHAQAALVYVYSELHEPKKAVAAFEAVRKSSVGLDLLVPAGSLAAVAMVRVGKVGDAEKLARTLLTRIKGKKISDREGELHRLLARIYSRSGRLNEAVGEAQLAAKAFELAGDLYHAATAHGFIGDLYRETGDFELAKIAFLRFRELAEKWGDRDLLQVAELADAWVSLDVGDLTHASKEIAAVEKEMSAAPSRRLKRYLAAARALLEAGRGRHRTAASMLVPVIDSWESAGQRSIADILRAQRVRSLIAGNDLDQARKLVDEALDRLDAKVEAPRVASFLRESALIRLRRKDVKRAMSELAQARKLFAKGGNRREEALTIYRIAHAAFEEGDVDLAASRCKEALTLARKIKHARVIALSRELQGRVDLIHNKPKSAVTASKEALQALRKLGDELGTLHVSESLLRALIASGDLAGALRLGPKVSDQAEKLEIREMRIRAIVLTGVALLRKGRPDAAARCFREVPDQALSPLTTGLMWRLGEGLAAVQDNLAEVFKRRGKWVAALRRMPQEHQQMALQLLDQMVLPPRERCALRTRDGAQVVSTEQIGWMELEKSDLFVDVENRRILDGGQVVAIDNPALRKVFNRLVIAAPEVLPNASIYQAVHNEAPPEKFEKKLKTPIKQLQKAVKDAKHIKILEAKDGLKLSLPKSYAFLVPRAVDYPDLTGAQRLMLRLLRRYATLPLQTLQAQTRLNRSAARRELTALMRLKLVEAVRDGRGQAFRLA